MKWDLGVCVSHNLMTCARYPLPYEEFERFRQIVPGIPDGIAITLGDNEEEYLTGSKYEALIKHAPWSFAREFVVHVRYADTGCLADWCKEKLKPKARTSQAEWLRDAIDKTVASMAYTIRPSTLASWRDLPFVARDEGVYFTWVLLLCHRYCIPFYGTKGTDIEMQLIMWLKPFIDWHKQWVKLGRPLNLDED